MGQEAGEGGVKNEWSWEIFAYTSFSIQAFGYPNVSTKYLGFIQWNCAELVSPSLHMTVRWHLNKTVHPILLKWTSPGSAM